MVGRALDWLRASAAADDVGVKVLKLESDVKENSTIEFSSIIKNYGSETQSAIDVRATIFDSEVMKYGVIINRYLDRWSLVKKKC